MDLATIDRDFICGILLLRDRNDPPRYYVQWKQRRDLIAIGDEGLARQRFAVWCARGVEKLLMEGVARRLKARRRPVNFLRHAETELEGPPP
jgi:hypothetical protein